MNLTELFQVLLVAASPIIELRGAIPLAIYTYDFPWYWALTIAIIGNILPVPILLLFWKNLSTLLTRMGISRQILVWVLAHTGRQKKQIEKYGELGLAIFVAIPLPGTGAWTGSIVAFLLGMEFKRAFLSILAGVIIAGVIVTCLSLLGWIGAVLAGIGLITLLVLKERNS